MINLYSSFGYNRERSDDVLIARRGALTLHERRIGSGWESQESCWILLRDGAVLSKHSIVQRLNSGVELRDLMLRAGLSDVRLYGGLDGAPFDNRALRLVTSGAKASSASD